MEDRAPEFGVHGESWKLSAEYLVVYMLTGCDSLGPLHLRYLLRPPIAL